MARYVEVGEQVPVRVQRMAYKERDAATGGSCSRCGHETSQTLWGAPAGMNLSLGPLRSIKPLRRYFIGTRLWYLTCDSCGTVSEMIRDKSRADALKGQPASA